MKGLGIGCTPTVALCVGKVVRGQRIWGKPRVEIEGQVVGKPRAGGPWWLVVVVIASMPVCTGVN